MINQLGFKLMGIPSRRNNRQRVENMVSLLGRKASSRTAQLPYGAMAQATLRCEVGSLYPLLRRRNKKRLHLGKYRLTS